MIEKLLYSDCSQLDWIQKTKLIDDLRLTIHQHRKILKNYDSLKTDINQIERQCMAMMDEKQNRSTMSIPSLETAMMQHTQQIKDRIINKKSEVKMKMEILKEKQRLNNELRQRMEFPNNESKIESYFDILSQVEHIQQKIINNEQHRTKLIQIIENTQQTINQLKDTSKIDEVRETLELKQRHMRYLNVEMECKIRKKQHQLSTMDKMMKQAEEQIWRLREQSCKIRHFNGIYQKDVEMYREALMNLKEDGRVLKNLLKEIEGDRQDDDEEKSTAGKRLKALPSEMDQENELDRTVVISPRKMSVKRR